MADPMATHARVRLRRRRPRRRRRRAAAHGGETPAMTKQGLPATDSRENNTYA
jgi:hypothetical protein